MPLLGRDGNLKRPGAVAQCEKFLLPQGRHPERPSGREGSCVIHPFAPAAEARQIPSTSLRATLFGTGVPKADVSGEAWHRTEPLPGMGRGLGTPQSNCASQKYYEPALPSCARPGRVRGPAPTWAVLGRKLWCRAAVSCIYRTSKSSEV